MLVSPKEFLHTIQKHKLSERELMIGINEVVDNFHRVDAAKSKGYEFFFTFPPLVTENGNRVIQLICRHPDHVDVTGDNPAVRLFEVLSLLAH